MKKEKRIPRKLLWALPFLLWAMACSDDDSDPMETWQMEVAQVTTATTKYANIAMATADGFIDVSGFVPNMGHHYLLPTRVDNTFVLEDPSKNGVRIRLQETEGRPGQLTIRCPYELESATRTNFLGEPVFELSKNNKMVFIGVVMTITLGKRFLRNSNSLNSWNLTSRLRIFLAHA